MNKSKDIPPTTFIRQTDTHRLIPSKYNPDAADVLQRIADSASHLLDLITLSDATSDQLWAENGLLPGISSHELIFGIQNYRVVNAAFTHAHPLGSRFNGPDRGAWYAAFALQTAQKEVAFHKSTEYAEIGRWDDSITYDDYLADFNGTFHDLRRTREFDAALSSETYLLSQALAQRLLANDSCGIVYPSVRHVDGTCLACFRPALVSHVRKEKTYRFTWNGTPKPKITRVNA